MVTHESRCNGCAWLRLGIVYCKISLEYKKEIPLFFFPVARFFEKETPAFIQEESSQGIENTFSVKCHTWWPKMGPIKWPIRHNVLRGSRGQMPVL